jgi:hypothetical protein
MSEAPHPLFPEDAVSEETQAIHAIYAEELADRQMEVNQSVGNLTEKDAHQVAVDMLVIGTLLKEARKDRAIGQNDFDLAN